MSGPAPENVYDVIVIGAGPIGKTVADRARTAGLSVAAVERELVGGEVLFATGRQPLTDDIGLDTVGLVPGSWLEADDTCTVRAIEDGWLYALGDVNHHALLPLHQRSLAPPARGLPELS